MKCITQIDNNKTAMSFNAATAAVGNLVMQLDRRERGEVVTLQTFARTNSHRQTQNTLAH